MIKTIAENTYSKILGKQWFGLAFAGSFPIAVLLRFSRVSYAVSTTARDKGRASVHCTFFNHVAVNSLYITKKQSLPLLDPENTTTIETLINKTETLITKQKHS